MNKKEKKLQIVEVLRRNIEGCETYQRKPWTFVKFVTFYGNGRGRPKTYNGFGFSKVCYPDRWDNQEGVRLAVDKALHYLAKEIISES